LTAVYQSFRGAASTGPYPGAQRRQLRLSAELIEHALKDLYALGLAIWAKLRLLPLHVVCAAAACAAASVASQP